MRLWHYAMGEWAQIPGSVRHVKAWLIALAAALPCLVLVTVGPSVAEAPTYTYGNPANYLSELGTSDVNGDGVIVYKHTTKEGTPQHEAWQVAVSDWNRVEANHGGRGLRLVNAKHTDLRTEINLGMCEGDAYSGWIDKEPGLDKGCFFRGRIERWSEAKLHFIARHELGHALGLGHRPKEHKHLSVMAFDLNGENGTHPTIGPADIETWEYLWMSGSRGSGPG